MTYNNKLNTGFSTLLMAFFSPSAKPLIVNAEAAGGVFRGSSPALLTCSMGGRLALHALLEKDHP